MKLPAHVLFRKEVSLSSGNPEASLTSQRSTQLSRSLRPLKNEIANHSTGSTTCRRSMPST